MISCLAKKNMEPDPEKIKEIWETPAPEKKASQSFLGLSNYIKRFIHDYTHEQAFNNLKQSPSSESCALTTIKRDIYLHRC